MILKALTHFLVIFPINLVISSSTPFESKNEYIQNSANQVDFDVLGYEDFPFQAEVKEFRKRKRKVKDDVNDDDDVGDEKSDDFEYKMRKKNYKSFYSAVNDFHFDEDLFVEALEEIDPVDMKSFVCFINETLQTFPAEKPVISSLIVENMNLDWILYALKQEFPILPFLKQKEVLEKALDYKNIELLDYLLEYEEEPSKLINRKFPGKYEPEFIEQLSSDGREYRKKLERICKSLQTFQKNLKTRICTNCHLHELVMNRKNVLISTYRTASLLRSLWYQGEIFIFVNFEGEEGYDHGGLKTEWLGLLLESFLISDPTRILDGSTYCSTPNQVSSSSAEGNSIDFTQPFFLENDDGIYLPNLNYDPKYFQFVGSVLGFAFVYGIEFGFELIPSFYRILLGESYVEHPENAIEDLKSMNIKCHRNLTGLRSPDTNLEDLHLSIEDLESFIAKQALLYAYTNYKPHLESMKNGFLQILGSDDNFRSIGFDVKSLKQILTGSLVISAKEFAKHVNQTKLTDSNTKKWIFEILEEFNDSERMHLFSFITAKRVVPFNGLERLPLKIEFQSVQMGDESYYPRASTCRSILIIPVYKSKQMLKDKLLYSIHYCKTFDLE